ncbi:hypothetical protein [Brumimicrobium salinarum]|nr:hypothetical protein [Brumimicrobium salinarum]
MLKSFILSFFGLFILFINTALGQVRESKSAIKNEVMVRMLDDKNPTYILKSIPQHFNVKIDRVLSPQSDIWLLKFDTNQVNLETVIAEIKK